MTLPSFGRRALIGAASAVALTSVPTKVNAADSARHKARVGFTLNARTLDGGEQVVSLTLDTSSWGPVDPSSLTPETFSVHAKAVSPIPIAADDRIFSEYDLDRPVTAVTQNRHGDLVLTLSTAEGQLGGGTLGYILSARRNVRLMLTYTVVQNAPLRMRNGRSVVFPAFRQGRLVNREVDVYRRGVSRTGMNFRLFVPAGSSHHPRRGRGKRGRGKRPLVVWLHGGGEGGMGSYYDNETPLRANRGALGFSTPRGQRIFGGAYVVVPQCPSAWMLDGPRFAPQVKALVDDLVRRLPIDRRRVLVIGCSNGGYMSLEMTNRYRGAFAASVPICPGATAEYFTDAELAGIRTPTWMVASADDTVLPPADNLERAYRLVPGARKTLYDEVVWKGYKFPGHWSWIYVAHNDPQINGQRIWQWMAAQRA